jgi:hypothetical protein
MDGDVYFFEVRLVVGSDHCQGDLGGSQNSPVLTFNVAGGSNVGKVSLLANVERPDAAHRPRMTSRTFPPKANGFQPQVKNRDQKQPEHVLDRINLGRYVVERCKYELILNSIQT